MHIVTIDDIEVPTGTHEGKNIVICSDHRGYDLKQGLIQKLESGYSVQDIGCDSIERCDYPDYGSELGKRVGIDRHFKTVGIAICGSGNILIPVNKQRGAYCGACTTVEDAKLSRIHNNTNVLALSANKTDLETAIMIVEAFLTTPFNRTGSDRAYLERFIKTVKEETAAYDG